MHAGIEPYVTIFHFDIPQCLEDEYGAFLSEKIVQDFAEYAEVCFFEFGDRVKHWATMNEMVTHAVNAYASGYFPPNHGVTPSVARSLETNALGYRTFRRSGDELARIETFSVGDAGTEPYICAHNMLIAHATAVDVYRKRYQAVQGGKIGVVNVSNWYEPLNDTEEDKAAAARAVDFMWGWFMSPIVHGDYPPTMRQIVGKRLPKFTNDQTKLLIGSYDYIGMNYYTTNYATNAPNPANTRPTYYTDRQVELLSKYIYIFIY
ncbi:hypothetical protein RD792_010948 [Penstemon davidsonii]|uniref:Beta-glucosidase n=1 Tax=Penstemon davidsonii TaxID=160366 RepID=A0ABR0D4Q4_9LAMI|nr:hypothetical protein RD792_010948 [Penstemon davidsonii]